MADKTIFRFCWGILGSFGWVVERSHSFAIFVVMSRNSYKQRSFCCEINVNVTSINLTCLFPTFLKDLTWRVSFKNRFIVGKIVLNRTIVWTPSRIFWRSCGDGFNFNVFSQLSFIRWHGLPLQSSYCFSLHHLNEPKTPVLNKVLFLQLSSMFHLLHNAVLKVWTCTT